MNYHLRLQRESELFSMTAMMANATTLFARGKCSKEGTVKSFLRPLQKRQFSGEQLRHRVVELGWCKKVVGHCLILVFIVRLAVP